MYRLVLLYVLLTVVWVRRLGEAECPVSFTPDEVPNSCKIGAPKESICTVCIDECCAMLERRTPNIPCPELLNACVKHIVGLLALGGMDVNSFLQCDPAGIGQRIVGQLRCQGTPPSADDIAKAYSSILPAASPTTP